MFLDSIKNLFIDLSNQPILKDPWTGKQPSLQKYCVKGWLLLKPFAKSHYHKRCAFFKILSKVQKRLFYKKKDKEDVVEDTNVLIPLEEDYPLLIEAGFIAIKQKDEIAARRLFKAAEVLSSTNPASKIGLGYIELNKLRVAQALEIFQSVVNEHPKHHLAKALLGVTFLLTPDKKQAGEAILEEIGSSTDDPTIQNLATISLEWVKKGFGTKGPLQTKVQF